jgi:hypothetical protein
VRRDTSEILPFEAPAALSDALLRDVLATFRYARMRVTGECMRPTLLPGDVAIVASAERRPPRIGDVVLVRHAEGLRLHRLVLRWRGSWRTMGDRTTRLDPPVGAGSILGTVAGVEGRPMTRRLQSTIRALLHAFFARFQQVLPGTGRA